MENNLTCASREAAILALETLARTMPMGTQRQALEAVKCWIAENTRPSLNDEETKKKLVEIFRKTPGEEKGWEWYCRGLIDGKPTEPEDGAEWTCKYHSQTKRWEPTNDPPEIMKKTDFEDGFNIVVLPPGSDCMLKSENE